MELEFGFELGFRFGSEFGFGFEFAGGGGGGNAAAELRLLGLFHLVPARSCIRASPVAIATMIS